MSNYRSIESSSSNHDVVSDDDDDRNPDPRQSSPQPPVGAASNLLGLFDPPAPPTPSNQQQQQPIPSSVAKTPISSGRSRPRPYNDNSTTNEHVPLLQQQQQHQQQQQEDHPSFPPSSQSVVTTAMHEWDGSVVTTTPLLSVDDSENEVDSFMRTPKQNLRHSTSSLSTSAYTNTSSNHQLNSNLDHRSRMDSIHEILPPIHETVSYPDDIDVPSAPMTPISTWLHHGSSDNPNHKNNNPCHGNSEHLMAPTLVDHDTQQKQPLLSMNHYVEEETTTAQQQQQQSLPFVRVSWWNSTTVQTIVSDLTSPSTYIGAFLFLLFELVFSLTIGATITRSSSSSGRSMLGLVTKIATLGTILGGPVYWFNLRDVPALYPVVDLFAAPFLANIATIIDEALYNDPNVSDIDSDEIFLTTFSFLSGISLFISGCFMILASVFKLANLGSFLPFPVLCGFFTAAACMTWTLAFKVDTNGLTVSHVIWSGDTRLIVQSLVHHIPSVLVGATMKYLGPKHPLFVLMSVMITIGVFYTTMFIFGISFHEMIDMHWFWSENDLHYEPQNGGKVRSPNISSTWFHSESLLIILLL